MSRVALIGSGLAASATACALLDRGVAPSDILVVAPALDRHDSSSCPGALCHALPGRSLRPPQGALQAFDQSVKWLDHWYHERPDLIQKLPWIMRPDRGGRLGRRYVNSYLTHAEVYDAHLTHTLLDDQAIIEQRAPMLGEDVQRAVCYGPSYSVDLGALIDHIWRALAARGIERLDHRAERLVSGPRGWSIGDTQRSAQHVVVCVGAWLGTWFPQASLAINGGELMLAHPPEGSAPLEGAISGGGHLAPHPDGAHWVLGATYLQPDESQGHAPSDPTFFERSEQEAIEDIMSLIARFVPSVRACEPRRVWRSRRAVFLTDRQAICGACPGAPGVWLLGALGSKGLLWSPHLAHHLAGQIVGQHRDDHEIAGTSRLAPDRWRSPRIVSSS